MARRKTERVKEINNILSDYREKLEQALIDYEDADSRVMYYEDQIRRLVDNKRSLVKSK